MPEATRVLGVAGSLRAGSFNRSLLRAAVELVADAMGLAARLTTFPDPTDPWLGVEATFTERVAPVAARPAA